MRLLSLVLVLAAVPLSAYAQAAVNSTAPSVLITAETPRQGSLPRLLTLYGTMQAAPGDGSETVSLLRAGQVTAVMTSPGVAVQHGQALLRVSADPAAIAAYNQAVDTLKVARGTRARTAQMLAQRLATRDQLAQADKAVADAQSSLDVLKRAGGGSAEQTIEAPFDGVVSSLPAPPGTRFVPGTSLAMLVRSSKLVASVGVEPGDRGLVTSGAPARVEPLYGGGTEQGSVLSVGAMLDPMTRLVPVLVDPPEDTRPVAAPSALLPGTPVRVLVQVGEIKGWLVPRDAVLTDAKGPYVFQVSGSKATRVDVHVEGTAGDTTVISGPLDPARSLVTSGNYQLEDGGTVRMQQASAAGTAP